MPYRLHAHKSGLLHALDILEQFLMKGKYVLGTVWYIFRFKMDMNCQSMVVCLVCLPWKPVARGAELLYAERAVRLPHCSGLSMKMSCLVFRGTGWQELAVSVNSIPGTACSWPRTLFVLCTANH